MSEVDPSNYWVSKFKDQEWIDTKDMRNDILRHGDNNQLAIFTHPRACSGHKKVFICQSKQQQILFLTPPEKNDVEQMQIPTRVSDNAWEVKPIAPKLQQTWMFYHRSNDAKLEHCIKLNDIPNPGVKLKLISLIMSGLVNGILPRCPQCNSHLEFLETRKMFVCAQDLSESLFRCPFETANPIFKQFIPLSFDEYSDEVTCQFELVARKPKNGKWSMVWSGCYFLHKQCIGHRSTADIAKNRFREMGLLDVPMTEKGRLEEQRNVQLQTCSKTTTRRGRQYLYDEEVEAPRLESFSQLNSFALEFASKNSGSCMTMLLRTSENQLIKRVYINNSFEDKLDDSTKDVSIETIGKINFRILRDAAIAAQKALDEVKNYLNEVCNEKIEIVENDCELELEQKEEQKLIILENYQRQVEETIETYTQFIEKNTNIISKAACTELDASDLTEDDVITEFDPIKSDDGKLTVVSISMVFGSMIKLSKTIGLNVFGFDGAHCKDGQQGNLKGQILSMVTMDSLKKIIILGSVFCDSESYDNYRLLVDSLNIAGLELNNPAYTLLSDRSRAGASLMKYRLPLARPRYCEFHIILNIRDRFKNVLDDEVKLVRNCFRAITESDFHYNFGLLKDSNPSVYSYLNKIDIDFWATYKFLEKGNSTFGIVTNNMSESNQHRLLECRKAKTIFECLSLQSQLVERILISHREEVKNEHDM
jgi:hypothetical protein